MFKKITKSFQFEEVTGFKLGNIPPGAPKMFSHVYFVDGLLIDTGHSKVKSQVKAITKDLAIEQIFITHYHEDHSGNIQTIEEKHPVPVYASPLCCEMMQDPPPISFAQKLIWGNRNPHFNLIPKENFIETNQYKFEIIPIPGHAPDMVALYEPNKKWLFSADLFVNSYISYFIDYESMLEQINSIKQILKLDFEVMFCGHNPQLYDGKQKLKAKLNFLETFYQEVSNLHLKDYSNQEIFKRLKLKENTFVKLLSGGSLSKMNMVNAVVRDLKTKA